MKLSFVLPPTANWPNLTPALKKGPWSSRSTQLSVSGAIVVSQWEHRSTADDDNRDFPVPANSYYNNLTSGEKITKKSSISEAQSWQVLFRIKSKWKKSQSSAREVHLLFKQQNKISFFT